MTDSRALADALIFPYLNHAAWMYEEGYATREDIDAGMRFGCGLPKGPLALLDEMGLQAVVEELESRHPETGDPLHEPRPVLRELLEKGRGGVVDGTGFYTYAEPGSSEVVPDDQTPGTPDLSDERHVHSVGVVGSGTMATGIVEVLAKAGYAVTYVARTQDKVDGVKAAIEKNQARAIEKGRSTQEEADALLGRLTGATSREALTDVDLVVEAIAEDLPIKEELFRDLDRLCKDGAVLATTTSSLPIKACAAVTKRPQDVVGLHFFNPAPVMKLVEVVHTDETAHDVVSTALDVCFKTKKVPVQCGDRAGFIVNCLLFPYLNDAIKMVDAGECTMDELDEAIKEHYGYPMGPFALLDVVGLDVSLAIENELDKEFGHKGFAPSPTLEKLVAEGKLGRKTKEGFRAY